MKPPSDLCRVAKAKWSELLRDDMWGKAVLAADADVLAEYCRLHARKVKAEKMVAEHGELVASPNGFPVQSPWMQIVNKCRTEMLRIATEFGGTPGSRVKMNKPVVEGKKAQRQAQAEEVASGLFAPRVRPTLAVDNG